MRWSAGPLREILLLFSPTDTMSRPGEPTGSKYGCPAAQFANSASHGRATGLPSPCSIAPFPSSTSSLADHRLRGRTGRHRWHCGVPDVRPSRLRHGPRTLPRLRPRPRGSIPPLADESAVSRHGADQVHSLTHLHCREAHRHDPARVPGSAAPFFMGQPATQVGCIKRPAHNGAAAQGLWPTCSGSSRTHGTSHQRGSRASSRCESGRVRPLGAGRLTLRIFACSGTGGSNDCAPHP